MGDETLLPTGGPRCISVPFRDGQIGNPSLNSLASARSRLLMLGPLKPSHCRGLVRRVKAGRRVILAVSNTLSVGRGHLKSRTLAEKKHGRVRRGIQRALWVHGRV